jgi:hypothetical protein
VHLVGFVIMKFVTTHGHMNANFQLYLKTENSLPYSQEPQSLIKSIQSPHTHPIPFRLIQATTWTILGLNPGRGKRFICCPTEASRPTLGPIQPPIQCVRGSFRGGGDSAEREANTHLQLLPKLRNSGAISLLHHMPR